jgi:hypothetical protein
MAGVEVQTIWQGLNGIRYQTEDKKTWYVFFGEDFFFFEAVTNERRLTFLEVLLLKCPMDWLPGLSEKWKL